MELNSQSNRWLQIWFCSGREVLIAIEPWDDQKVDTNQVLPAGPPVVRTDINGVVCRGETVILLQPLYLYKVFQHG